MRVVLAYKWTDAKGKTHDPDTSVNVTPDVAARLVRDGKARPAAPHPTTKQSEA